MVFEWKKKKMHWFLYFPVHEDEDKEGEKESFTWLKFVIKKFVGMRRARC